MAKVTAGLMCPPEIGPTMVMTMAKAAPIAIALPVTKIIYRKKQVPKNSAKYFCIWFWRNNIIILLENIIFGIDIRNRYYINKNKNQT